MALTSFNASDAATAAPQVWSKKSNLFVDNDVADFIIGAVVVAATTYVVCRALGTIDAMITTKIMEKKIEKEVAKAA